MGLIKKKYVFVALAPTGSGISGSDRIFIELARNWSQQFSVEIITTQEGRKMIERQKLSGPNLSIKVIGGKLKLNFLLKYVYKIILGVGLGFNLKIKTYEPTLIYSSSDFWMDSLPAVLLKIRYPKIKWVATWYQTAPNPILGFSENGNRETKYNFSAFLYWFSQLPIKPLINFFADWVIVNNESERQRFSIKDSKGKVIVLIGAVRLDEINSFISKFPNEKKVFDAVFQGRFHPQKGVVELIRIWKIIVEKRPEAMLAMIGDGPLMPRVKEKIKDLKLEKNVRLFGYVFDGQQKYRIFSQSKMVVHPAFYDSGGMAAAEAMAFGIPSVGFNLKAYNSYYPKGMIKVKTGNLNSFAEAVLELLDDSKKRKTLGQGALNMINGNWSWKHRAQSLLETLS